MYEGPLGVTRPFGIAPFANDVEERNERIERTLSRYAKRGRVNMEDRLTGTQFNFRLDIPHGSEELPLSQNIPSNVSVVGDKVKGTLRPPLVWKGAVHNETDLRTRIYDIIGRREGVEVLLPESSSGSNYRPHIAFDRPATVTDYLEDTEELVKQYEEEFS